jgi:hypothetical protein
MKGCNRELIKDPTVFLSVTATVTILEAAALCSKVADYESQIPATAQNVP